MGGSPFAVTDVNPSLLCLLVPRMPTPSPGMHAAFDQRRQAQYEGRHAPPHHRTASIEPLHRVALLDDVPIARQDGGDMNHHRDSLALRVAVELWLHRTSQHLVPHWPAVVNRGLAHKLPDDALWGMPEQDTHVWVLRNMVERLPFDAVPVGQGRVIQDHHTAAKTHMRLSSFRRRRQNTGCAIGDGVVDEVPHFLRHLDHRSGPPWCAWGAVAWGWPRQDNGHSSAHVLVRLTPSRHHLSLSRFHRNLHFSAALKFPWLQ